MTDPAATAAEARTDSSGDEGVDRALDGLPQPPGSATSADDTGLDAAIDAVAQVQQRLQQRLSDLSP